MFYPRGLEEITKAAMVTALARINVLSTKNIKYNKRVKNREILNGKRGK